MRALPLVAIAVLSCAPSSNVPGGADAAVGRSRAGLTQEVVYVGKESTTDFTGLGQHLQYWPMFGRSSGESGQRTDCDDCIEMTGGVSGDDFQNFDHHIVFPLDKRTFSPDALGSPIGVKTAGGYGDWATFTLPDGETGVSGTFYDTHAIDNSNNSVNQIILDEGAPSEFCLNLITDNTGGQHDPDVRLEARSDDVNANLAGHTDLSFDGSTDMYTFLYQGMEEGDRIKIRFNCSSSSGCQGPGLGGIMVSEVSTCTGSDSDPDAGVEEMADAGAEDPGAPDAGGGTGASSDAGAGGDGEDPAGAGCATAAPMESMGLSLVLLGWLLARRRRGRAKPSSS